MFQRDFSVILEPRRGETCIIGAKKVLRVSKQKVSKGNQFQYFRSLPSGRSLSRRENGTFWYEWKARRVKIKVEVESKQSMKPFGRTRRLEIINPKRPTKET